MLLEHHDEDIKWIVEEEHIAISFLAIFLRHDERMPDFFNN